MKFEVDQLPYGLDELAPFISAKTVDIHYNKHHAGYMSKLAAAIEGKSQAGLPLEEVIRTAHDKGETGVFRNAAQVWNHTFYWNSLSPDGGGKPGGVIASLIERDFSSLDKLQRQLAEIATGQFGSGWAWLVLDDAGRLQVVSTSDADNPLLQNQYPLLTLDVWEHAYYLDYQNERNTYVQNCIEHLLNWRFAESNVELATAGSPAFRSQVAS